MKIFGERGIAESGVRYVSVATFLERLDGIGLCWNRCGK